MINNSIDQKWDHGNIVIAVGYAINARLIELTDELTGDPCAFKYPTTANTANPATNERHELLSAMIKLSMMIGFLVSLYDPYDVMIPMQTEREKKICPAASSQISGSLRASTNLFVDS